MSYHFNAGQFDKPFLPKHLGNWEVPHWYPKKPKPTAARGTTLPIVEPQSNRLLPRVHRGAPAWGYRRTAWDYPSRITRQLADELSKAPPVARYTDWNSQANDIKENKLPPNDISTVEKFKEADIGETEDAVDQARDDDYTQGPIEALNLKDIENLKDITLDNIENPIEMNKHSSKSKSDAPKHKCRSLPIVDPFAGFHYARKMHMDNLLHHPLPDTMGSKDTHAQHIPGRDLIVKPYASEWKGSSYPNEHRPLTCVGTHKNIPCNDTNRPATSGGEKENKLKFLSPMDLAICWDFRTANPRDEPKRPKHIDGSNGSLAPAVFSMVHSPKQNTLNIPETGRSNAIFSQNILPADFEEDRILPSFEKDMSKEKRKDACDVPKCSQHSCFEKRIYQNNKSKSPSEKSSKKSENKNKCDGIHGCGTIESPSSRVSTTNHKHIYKIKNAWEETKENYSPKSKKNRAEKYGHLERAGSLDHLNNNCANSVQSLNEQNKMYRSSPNISKHGSNGKDEDVSSCTESCKKTRSRNNYNRDCKACVEHKPKMNSGTAKPEYKMAFKAGKPNSNGSTDSKNGDVSTTITTTTKNSLRIPKMRDPYSKKSYAIPTLTPPFSRWHDTSGYPEHWRLASVYQHAYKPPGPKRRPLLPAVYK